MESRLYAKKVITHEEKMYFETFVGSKKMERLLDVVILSLKINQCYKFKGFLEAMEESDDMSLIKTAKDLGELLLIHTYNQCWVRSSGLPRSLVTFSSGNMGQPDQTKSQFIKVIYRIAGNFRGNKISNFSLYNFQINIFESGITFETFALVLYCVLCFLTACKSLAFGTSRKGSARETGLMQVFILCCAWISRL